MVVNGSGASSIQTVPAMAPFLKHIDVFVRTPAWFVQIVDNFGNNHECKLKLRLRLPTYANTRVTTLT